MRLRLKIVVQGSMVVFFNMSVLSCVEISHYLTLKDAYSFTDYVLCKFS